MRVHLHIDRIVLEGVPLSGAETARLTRALERTLAHEVACGGIDVASLRGEALAAIVAPAISVAAGARGAEVGEALAKSIHASLAPSLGARPEASRNGQSKGEGGRGVSAPRGARGGAR